MTITYDRAVHAARVKLMADVNDRAAEAMRQNERPYATAARTDIAATPTVTGVRRPPYTLGDLKPFLGPVSRPGLDAYSYTPRALPGLGGDSSMFAANGHTLFAVALDGVVPDSRGEDWAVPPDAPTRAPVTVQTVAALGDPSRAVPAAKNVMPQPGTGVGLDVEIHAAAAKAILSAARTGAKHTFSVVVIGEPDPMTRRAEVGLQVVGPRTLQYGMFSATDRQDFESHAPAHVTFNLAYFADALRAVRKHGSGSIRLATADSSGLGPAVLWDADATFGDAHAVCVVMPYRVDNAGSIMRRAREHHGPAVVDVPKAAPITWEERSAPKDSRMFIGRWDGPGDHTVLLTEHPQGSWRIDIGPRQRQTPFATYHRTALPQAKQYGAMVLTQLAAGIAHPLLPIHNV